MAAPSKSSSKSPRPSARRSNKPCWWSEVAADIGADLVAVYVPQAPIPTSGFLLYLPRATLKPLSIPPDEALKRVISLGIIKHEPSTSGK
jgi:uncharacterized membrane protein